MPINTESCTAGVDHLVHFFDTDAGLVGVVASYLSSAVLDGETTIIIATPAHVALFEQALVTAGVDLVAAIGDGRLRLHDAAATLGRFETDGAVDEAAFDRVVGGLVRDASTAGRPLRAYGEMVASLWSAGHVDAAIDLERMWNRLGETVPFSLFCAYPHHLFGGFADSEAFSDVCHLHSGVVGAAPTTPRSEVTRRFPMTLQTPRDARCFVAETLRGWNWDSLSDDAVLVVAELTTNAVVHAGSDVAVCLSRLDDGVRVVVGDRSVAPVAPRVPEATAPGGRGLSIIDAVARRWGQDVVDGGKLIWADIGPVTEHPAG